MELQTDIERVMLRANHAFRLYKTITGQERARFLLSIAENIEALGDTLTSTAMRETNLPEPRIKNETIRTVNQLKLFARLLQDGDWCRPVIDAGDPKRSPIKPDIRKMFFPLGPVVVFGASNFPLAFSTAGGDTASALAAGCSVIVKAHPAHPETSKLVAGAIQKAMLSCSMPEYTFQHVDDTSLKTGQLLVRHTLTKAVAFTGSFHGGKALYDLVQQRTEPIPFFGEMGSLNPIVIFPEAMDNAGALASNISSSVLLGVGQFCTNPGLLIVLENNALQNFIEALTTAMATAQPGKMLHASIAKQYKTHKSKSLQQAGVNVLVSIEETENEITGAPTLAMVDAKEFTGNDVLHQEVFGPYSLVVKCKDEQEMVSVVSQLQGQLTASVFASERELENNSLLVNMLVERCGRFIYNAVPTGVEVCHAMQHGGPFPATTDSRFTSVGTDAIYRFVRPVCFQDYVQRLLPPELQDHNPLQLLRFVNGKWTRDPITPASN
jgi:alpha-ketoglutaric semialdehyde dehydrogenase